MNRKKARQTFPMEKKLAALEWKLELLRASITTTHTPLRTLKSMVESDVLPPARDSIKRIINPPLGKAKAKLAEIARL